MKPLRRAACVVALLGIVAAALAEGLPSARAGPPSVEDFFRKSQYGGAVLSPSARYLAVIAPVGEHRGLGIIDLETRAPPQTMAAGAGDDVLGILWQTDERLIVFLGDLQRVAGEWPHQSGMAAINRDGTYYRSLGGSVLRAIPGTNEVLVAANWRETIGLDLYRLDTVTRIKTLLSFESPGNVSEWVADFDGVPRAAVTDDLDRDTSAWYVRRSGSDAWTKVEEAKLGRLHSVPLQFDPDGKLLYVATRREGSDREAIYEYNVDTGSWSKAIAQHPERDLGAGTARFVASYRARKLLGLRYTDDRPATVWFDKEWARIQKSVDAALPETVNVISQGAGNAKRWMIVASSDRNPGEVYLLDSGTMRMEKLFSYRPWIDPKAMAPTKWVRYSARDGLSIPALLTLPLGASDKPLPLIVDIHGGPYVEADQWGYDREVQFFASRGYAVLQPQYRGTLGFGWKHESAGYRKWGDEMQDDLEDGVKWAVAKGIADPSRVCFYGASYGGYAAAWGAIKNAGLIKCAVAYVAVTSIDYLFDNAQTDVSRLADRSSLMPEQIGDPKTERARFKRINPLDNADKVGVPIFLAYGGSDVRVPLVHGTDFRSALDRYHKEYEWVEYGGEGHGFNRDEDVFDYYHRVEQFLAKYLHGDTPAVRSVAAPAK
jgi:dipeptidyl aminopeptidase/acylaminoacyl peptidase